MNVIIKTNYSSWLRPFRKNDSPKIWLILVNSLLSLGQFKFRHYLREQSFIACAVQMKEFSLNRHKCHQ